MINHILVPLDGSNLAESVLPHIMAIAPVTQARVTLIHVLEHPANRGNGWPVDPMGWHMQKQESQVYLERMTSRLQSAGIETMFNLMEGNPAESIVEYAHANAVDMIALSTHGRTGLSGWNISSVVQKVLLRAYRSILLVRAYTYDPTAEVKYERLFISSDCSTRAEFILPFAISLAQHHRSQVVVGTVVEKPGIIQRLPPSEEDIALINQLTERNQRTAEHCHQLITTQLSLKGVTAKTQVVVAEHTLGALHDMVENENADLVMMVAHGDSGERRWPYGSIATSFIAYGNAPLMIMQDLTESEVPPTSAELAVRESKGH